jgi:hypothetical protein
VHENITKTADAAKTATKAETPTATAKLQKLSQFLLFQKLLKPPLPLSLKLQLKLPS